MYCEYVINSSSSVHLLYSTEQQSYKLIVNTNVSMLIDKNGNASILVFKRSAYCTH